MWYVELRDPDYPTIAIERQGPFEQEAEAVADAKKRGRGWRVVSSTEELETGVVV